MNLTEAEYNVVDEYTGGESLWINNYLRDRNLEGVTVREKSRLKKFAEILNNIIRSAPASVASTTVYRGAEAMDPSWLNLSRDEELIFVSHGIISTSFSSRTALSFIEAESGCCLLILNLPKSTRGVYIGNASVFSDEDELLLPHGSVFVVTDVYVKNNVLTYEADLIGQ